MSAPSGALFFVAKIFQKTQHFLLTNATMFDII